MATAAERDPHLVVGVFERILQTPPAVSRHDSLLDLMPNR